MGRRQFSADEADRIRMILAERPRTKTTRDKLRSIGFYISDFGGGPPFSASDFDRLIAAGEITVCGSAATTPRPVAATQVSKRSAESFSDKDVEAARERYQPKHVRHLIVGESPPHGGTFFYFANSILYRQTRRAFFDVFGEVCGNEEEFLRFFRDKGFFLDDLCAVPVNGMDDPARLRERIAGVKPLAARIEMARPRTVIIVMKAIIPEVRGACELAGIAPSFVELPFPRPEHQAQFVAVLAAFIRALR